jgi:hypothetical protein
MCQGHSAYLPMHALPNLCHTGISSLAPFAAAVSLRVYDTLSSALKDAIRGICLDCLPEGYVGRTGG